MGIALAGLLLVLVLVPGIGREVNGARRWIDVGPIGFQPSELAKWAVVLFLAWYGATRCSRLGKFGRGLVPAALAVGLVCGLTLIEDLGTAILIAAVAAIMLLAAGARLRHMVALSIPAAAAVVVGVAAEPYRLRRLQAFLDPWQDPQGTGYHVIQSMTAIHGGGVGGRGLGNGVQKFGYLPEDTTDFVFSIVTEEFGLLGAALVTALVLGLLWTGWRIVHSQRNPGGQLLALGVTATITLQAVMNLLVVTGMAPTKGIALPLVSSGGTGWLLTAFMLGIMAGLDRPTPEIPPAASEEVPLMGDAVS